jgi:hypothetical protein
MTITMVRYTVHAEHAAANEELVRGVYAELDGARPDGLRYATFREADGLGFVHLALTEDDEHNPLTEVAAFRRFQEGIRERCAQPPVVTRLREMGSFRLPGG